MKALNIFGFFYIVTLVMPVTVVAEESIAKATKDELSALDQRIKIERATRLQSFVLTPHKPNYILPLSYNDEPNETSADVSGDGELDKNEVKFQFSMKFTIIENLFDNQGSVQFAYTNLSFWQAYNADASSPFRETVHEPEIFLIFQNDWEYLGFKNRLIQLGFVHQSNGQSEALSRSWNRFYADFIFQYGDFYLSLKPWYRLGGTGSGEESNPDIEKFLGHGEIRTVYAGGEHTFSIMLRNNFHSSNGAIELNWSFPMSRRVKWFAQYFNGYGESLIDYNVRVNRVGIGIAFTDWL